MLDFRFSNEPTGHNIDATAQLLVQPRLWIPGGDYPGHMEWREKAIAELQAEHKRAMLAFWGSEPVGGVVYQRHPNEPTVLELRNLSIEPHARGRHVASFLLRQAEIEGAIDFPSVTKIVGDTKITNSGMLAFLASNGYRVEGAAELDTSFAHNGITDVVLAKDLAAR